MFWNEYVPKGKNEWKICSGLDLHQEKAHEKLHKYKKAKAQSWS